MRPLHVERREPGRYIVAAVQVLAAAGRPLTAGEIADEVMARGLIRADGVSPDAAIVATLKRHTYGGPVVRVAGRGAARWTLRVGEGVTPDSIEKNEAAPSATDEA